MPYYFQVVFHIWIFWMITTCGVFCIAFISIKQLYANFIYANFDFGTLYVGENFLALICADYVSFMS